MLGQRINRAFLCAKMHVIMSDALNWNDLRYFLEVARSGRLQLAAKKLGVNHTTVSRRLAALETALQVQLFQQDATGYHLTSVGELLLPMAQKMEDATEHTRELISSSGKSLSGNFRIGAPDGIGNTFLTSTITEFLVMHPEISVEITPVPISLNLSRREVDMAVTIEPSSRKNIHSTKVVDYDLFLYTSNEYLERTGACLNSIGDLHAQTFSEYVADLMYSDQLLFNKDIDPRVQSRFRSSTVLAQLEFIASGGGVGVLPHFLAQSRPNLVQVLPDQYSLTRSYWLLMPVELRRLASIRAFEQFLITKASAHAPLFSCKDATSE